MDPLSAVVSLPSAAAHSAGHTAARSVSDRRSMGYRLEAELFRLNQTHHHQFEQIETDRDRLIHVDQTCIYSIRTESRALLNVQNFELAEVAVSSRDTQTAAGSLGCLARRD